MTRACDEDWFEDPEPVLGPLALTEVTVDVSDNPVVAELFGPGGEVLLELRERPPFGFQLP